MQTINNYWTVNLMFKIIYAKVALSATEIALTKAKKILHNRTKWNTNKTFRCEQSKHKHCYKRWISNFQSYRPYLFTKFTHYFEHTHSLFGSNSRFLSFKPKDGNIDIAALPSFLLKCKLRAFVFSVLCTDCIDCIRRNSKMS